VVHPILKLYDIS